MPEKKRYPTGYLFFFYYEVIVFTTDEFPGQATRPPPVADEGRVAWRSGQNRQRRTGAPDDLGHRKRATEVQILPPQPITKDTQ